MIQCQIKLYLRWLITLVFRLIQVIIPNAIVSIVSICRKDYDMPNFQHDETDVLLQTNHKTGYPGASLSIMTTCLYVISSDSTYMLEKSVITG